MASFPKERLTHTHDKSFVGLIGGTKPLQLLLRIANDYFTLSISSAPTEAGMPVLIHYWSREDGSGLKREDVNFER